MSNDENRDLYEILEISPNASQKTVERMYRYFAQRYHPDREGTGNAELFDQVVKAYRTLKEPEDRAAYDSNRKANVDYQWSLMEEAGDDENIYRDSIVQDRILSVLYTRRKREPRAPGLGSLQLERLTGCPQEMLDFHLWYLMDKGWIKRMDDGSMAITADGVDQSLSRHERGEKQKLIAAQ